MKENDTIYEVEMKFPLTDFEALESTLSNTFGAKFGEPIEEYDLYYNHPLRNFIETDEALRLRRKGNSLRITYKGPKIDTSSKTRKEIELELLPEDGSDWESLLESLGFRAGGHVRKYRRTANLVFRERTFKILCDELPQLGPNAFFIEIETMAKPDELDPARKEMFELAETLSLDPSKTIRTSYLSMIENQES